MSRLARRKSKFHLLAVSLTLVTMLVTGSGCCCTGWTLSGDWSLALGPGTDVGCYEGYDSCADGGGECGIEGGCGGLCCGGLGGDGGAAEAETHYGTGRFFPVPTHDVFHGPKMMPVPTREPLQSPGELPVPARDTIQPPPETGLLGPDNDVAPQDDPNAEELAPPSSSGESQVRDRWQPYRDGMVQTEPARLQPIPQAADPADWIYDDPPPQPASANERVTRRQRLTDDGWKAR